MSLHAGVAQGTTGSWGGGGKGGGGRGVGGRWGFQHYPSE